MTLLTEVSVVFITVHCKAVITVKLECNPWTTLSKIAHSTSCEIVKEGISVFHDFLGG